MTKTTPEQNKALVLEAFDTLFNKRDYEAAARFWSESYIQHSAISNQAARGCSTSSEARRTICATNTDSSWRKATTSLFTAASRATAVPPRG